MAYNMTGDNITFVVFGGSVWPYVSGKRDQSGIKGRNNLEWNEAEMSWGKGKKKKKLPIVEEFDMKPGSWIVFPAKQIHLVKQYGEGIGKERVVFSGQFLLEPIR